MTARVDVATDPEVIVVRALSGHAELKACVELQYATWGEGFSDAVPASILKVAQRIGGVVSGAFDSSNRLLGFVFGMTGVERGQIVHWSDMLAVRPEARDLGLGRRLKEHQRQVVRKLGATVIYWTYDPLIARNAHLNFNRLGVRVAEYVEDMYGATDSVLHGGIPTDRLVVAWPTADDEIEERLAEARRACASSDCEHAPIVTDAWITRAPSLPNCVRVEIPADAERILRDAPHEASEWRQRVRRGLQWAFAEGYTISAFSLAEGAEHGYYVMTKAPAAQ